jgi:hypothetical protein
LPVGRKSNNRARKNTQKLQKSLIYHFGSPHFNGCPIHLSWSALAKVFDQRLYGIWEKNCVACNVCQRKSFHLQTVKFRTDHHKKYTNKGKKPQLLA